MPLPRAVRTLLSLAVLLALRTLPAAAPAPLAAQCQVISGCESGGVGPAGIEPDTGSWSAAAATMQVVVNLTWCRPGDLLSVTLDGQSVMPGFVQSQGSLDCAEPSTASGAVTLTPGPHALTVQILHNGEILTTTAFYTYTQTGLPPGGGAVVQVTPDAQPVTRGAAQRATERFTVANAGSASAALSLGRTCAGAGVTGCTLSHAALTVPGGGIVSIGVNYTTGGAGTAGTVALVAWKTGDSATVNDAGSRQVSVIAAPVAGLVGDPAVTTAIDRSACLMLPAGLGGVYECGDLRLAHGLPATRILNRGFAPTLLYNSQHAYPYPVVSAEVPAPSGAPTVVLVSLTVSGVTRTREYAPWASGSMRLGIGFDATGLATGFYAYTLRVDARYANGTTAQLYPASGVASGTMPIVNRSGSRFGRGWWMAGVEEVKSIGDGTLMWIGGDGSTLRYVPVPTQAGRWTPEPYAGTDTIVQLPSDTARFARVLTGGDTVYFDAQGRHRRTANRRGHVTRFEWTADALTRMHLPRGQAFNPGTYYALEYANPYGMLSRVLAPGIGASRIVTFQNTDGRVTGISGPDTTGVLFSYVDATPRVTGGRDRRQVWTSWRYDQGSRLKRAVAGVGTPDSAVYAYSAQESRPLTAAPLHLVYTAFDGPRPDTDVNDRTYFWVDRRGAPVEVKDALGYVTRLYREDPLWPGQVTRVRYPNGREVTSTLDEAGRLSSTTDWATSVGGRFATTLYEWDARCGGVSRVTLPEGEVTSRGYDAQCRPEWSQVGADAARRVTFGYKALSDASAPGLPASVTEPGGHTSTFGYDANGNLRFTTTPGNDTTTFVNDAIGRVRITRTPIKRAQNLFQTDSVVYDVRDRVIRADSYGPRMVVDALVTADSQRVVVETDYDEEGLARSVSRRTQPDTTGIGTLVTRWKHDALGRVTAEIAADTTPATWDDNPRDTTVYNPAGLPVWTRTRRGDVLSSRYDAMGRPLWRHHTEVVYDSTSRGIPSRQRISSCLPSNTPAEHVYPLYPTDPGACTLRIAADSSVFAYDTMGNLRRAANGAATVRRGYLANGLLAADTLEIRTMTGGVSARAPYVLAYEYDLNGRRTALGHPGAIAPVANAVTRYAYDPVTGALASVTDPLGNLFSYRYDARGQLDTVALPGGMRQTYDYDGSGRLSLYRASIPTVASGQLLSDVTFQYDERGKMLESNDAGLGKEVMSARYSGLGHLVRSAYSSSGTVLFNVARVNQTTSLMSYDPLGNGYHTDNVTGGQSPDQNSLSNRWNSSAYQPLTGRLQINWDQTSNTEFRYDPAGNTVFEMNWVPGANFNGRDRVSYYGGDGKLRVVDARARTSSSEESATWEEYRYDALGRRVQVLAREWCTGARIECNHATVRRTVWDGDQALYEIRMVESEGDSDGTPSVQPIGLNKFNLNASLGRVLLTHGPGIDQPLSAIRMGYGDYHTNGYRSWPTFSAVPLWNQRGQAPFIAFGAGGNASVGMTVPGSRTFCPSAYTDGRCLGTQWLLAWDAYGARKNGTLRNYNLAQVWLGSAMEDQQDASGLLYRRNRYYDPATGRFTQEDPIGLEGGLNLYGFANGDPVTYSDPYGLYVKYQDEKSRAIMNKLRAKSALIDADLDAMEASTDVFIYRRGGLYNSPGTLWPPSRDKFGRMVHAVQIDPWNVKRFGRDSVIRKRGGISEEIVYAHETHSHAGPLARKEGTCDDLAGNHSADTCGVRKEQEWRKEQGLPERGYRGPGKPFYK